MAAPEETRPAGETQTGETQAGDLPELSDDAIDRIESRVFEGIASDRLRRRRRRRAAFAGVGAAAALVLVAAVAVPSVISGGGMGGDAAGSRAVEPGFDAAAPELVEDGAFVEGESAADAALEESADGSVISAVDTDREIVTNADMSVVVDDVPAAADQIADIADAAGGWVESMNVGTARPLPVEPYLQGDGIELYGPDLGAESTDVPAPEYGWVTVRVPAANLDDTISAVDDLGEVAELNVHRQDVTAQAIDLRARIDAAEASVERLTELMSQSGSVGDLIASESALSERQAMLESYRSQLEHLEDSVAMSTLSVNLSVDSVPVTADPAGFGDGFTAGWNALVALGNGLVVGLGFLLPWLVVAVVVAGAVWLLVVMVRRPRRPVDGDE